MKKFIKIISGLVLLLLAAIIIIPFVVDVDKYRPLIVDQVNSRINGKFSLGKLKLSLWGQIKVEVGGVELVDSSSRKIISVKDAYFHIPFSSLIGGSPSLSFNMVNPDVEIFKPKKGVMNVMTLMKAEVAPAAGSPSAQTPAPSTGSSGSVQVSTLPSMVINSKLGILLSQAKLVYTDEGAKSVYSVEDLRLEVKDVSATRPIMIEVSGNLNTQMPDLSVKGPFEIKTKIVSQILAGKPENVEIESSGDFSKIHIRKGSVFEKKPGVIADYAIKTKSNAQSFELQNFKFRFLNAEVSSSGKSSLTQSPSIDFTVKSNTIDLQPWSDVVPMLNEYNLSGQMKLDAMAKGPATSMEYGAEFHIKDLSAKSPQLKSQPMINADVVIVTDRLEKLELTFKAPGNDLRVTGKIVSFIKPKADFSILSSGLDLDQMIKFSPLPKKSDKAAAGVTPGSGAQGGAAGSGTSSSTVAGAVAPAADLDAMLDPVRENEMLAGMQALLNLDIKFIKAYESRFDNILLNFSFNDLNASLEKFQMTAFEGTLKSSGNVAMKPKMPTYRFQTDLNGFNIKKAVESQFEILKNTLIGMANFKMDLTGSSFNVAPAMKNLKAKGSFKVSDAQFTSVDVSRMASEAINEGLKKVSEKVPQAKNKQVGASKTARSFYEFIGADFSIENGNFEMPNFAGKAKKGLGVDLKGNTHVGLIDQSLKARWELIDTYDTMKARDIGVEFNGIKVEHILCEGNQPIKFPVTVGGTLAEPKYSYVEVPEYFVKVALNNLGGAAKGRAQAEINKLKGEAEKRLGEERAKLEAEKKRIEEEAKRRAEEEAKKAILNKAPPAVQQKAEDLRKKLFGR